MVGIVIVSHSIQVAEGICQMVAQISAADENTLTLVPAGGNALDKLGTDPNKILEAVKAADKGDGVAIICDLGSAVISSQTAISLLEEPLKSRVRIADAPLLEGAVGAAVEVASDPKATLEQVIANAESSRQLHKK